MRKSVKKKLQEGRGQGCGTAYVPFHKANESRSRGTAYQIPDPIERRTVHVLSDTEAMLYYLLRWNEEVEQIREQYLLDAERVNEVRRALGYSQVSYMTCYTTDFLVDYRNGVQRAFSVKFSQQDFDASSKRYAGREKRYVQLIERQNTERLYWESQGISFSIVTRDDLLQHRIQIKNIAFLMRFYDEMFISTTEQKLLYLLAHHVIHVPMENEFLNPRQLLAKADFDVDAAFEKFQELKEVM